MKENRALARSEDRCSWPVRRPAVWSLRSLVLRFANTVMYMIQIKAFECSLSTKS
jgi:hypothetical protein